MTIGFDTTTSDGSVVVVSRFAMDAHHMKMKTIFKIEGKSTEPKIGSQTQNTVGSHAPSPAMPGGGAVKQIGDRPTGDC